MFFPTLYPARVLKREKRFRLYVDFNGKEDVAYLPNPGRLQEIIYEGAKVLLKRVDGVSRRTSLEAVVGFAHGKIPVSLNAFLANKVFLENIEKIFPFAEEVKAEFVFEDSRFDFLINGEILVEVKSCTLVEGGTGLFPDAPTTRGTRHLQTLLRWPFKKALVFVVQRGDAKKVMPNYSMDPEFGKAMRELFGSLDYKVAFTCEVSEKGIFFKEFIPVSL